MKLPIFFGIFLLVQQVQANDSLLFMQEEKPLVSVNRSDFHHPVPGFPSIDDKKLFRLARQIEQQVEIPPKDAFINAHGQIVPEEAGIRLNKEKFLEQFIASYYREGPQVHEVPMRRVIPRVDSELLANIKTNLIGHYTTYFNSSNKERTTNIRLASEAINNQVVFPHERFSFNQAVGIRTKAKGYMPAPVIVRGELSEGIGGGICQVSSTLFNAVDRSGLNVIERFSHSKRVPYVPPGRDATVSWYGPDFVFINNYNQPVLIRSQVYGGTMAVMIYSSEAINTIHRQVPSAGTRLPVETLAEDEAEKKA